MTRFQTTDPGYRNIHGQIVISRTGFQSESFPGQIIYRLRCDHCKHEYGANGCDIHKRRCPRHQDGAKGETLREEPMSLFPSENV
jgi:hypothetical protein